MRIEIPLHHVSDLTPLRSHSELEGSAQIKGPKEHSRAACADTEQPCLEKLLLQRPENRNVRLSESTVTHSGSKKDSREIRSKDFLSSALGFTWQVRRFNLAGCLLDWNKEKMEKLPGALPSHLQGPGGQAQTLAILCQAVRRGRVYSFHSFLQNDPRNQSSQTRSPRRPQVLAAM